MNFYPIYKSKLEPWIKWWILKGNKIAPKILSEVIEGTTPITIEGVYKGTSLQELLFKGQTIQEGTPTPSAPIDVKTVTGENNIRISNADNTEYDDFRVDLGGKNLLALPNTSSITYTTIISEDVNNVIIKPLRKGQCFIYKNIVTNLEKGKQYTLSADITIEGSSYSGSLNIYYVNSTNNVEYLGYLNNVTKSRTITIPDDFVNLRLYFYCNGQNDDFSQEQASYLNIQLEKGTTATQYSPYNPNPIELCKIGDYQDYLYKENDTWYLHREIGKVVLNGSENWNVNRTGTVNWYYQLQNAVSNFNYDSDHSNYLSNIGVKASVGNTTTTQGVFILSTGELRVRYGIEDTVANWKAFLDTTNMLLYYPLLNPTTSEITDTTLLSQLEAIKNASLIPGTNEITQLPSDLPFILNFKYYMKG